MTLYVRMSAVIILGLSIHYARAEKVDMSPEDLAKTATHIVNGQVVKIYERNSKGSDYELTRYLAEVHVDKSEKGDGIKKGDLIYIRYWHRRWIGEGNPLPDTSGHRNLPAERDFVRAYLSRNAYNGFGTNNDGGLNVIGANGFEILNSAGHPDVKSRSAETIAVGKPVPLVVAANACGPLAAKYPFDPALYGKTKGYNPIGNVKGRAIVLYTRALDEGFFRVATAIETIVAEDKRLAGSMVIVIDEKGAQRGGYSVEDFQRRREQITDLAERHKIKHLSFFVAASAAESIAPRLLLTSDNLLVAFVATSDQPNSRATSRWLSPLTTSRLEDKNLEQSISLLKEVIASE